MAHRLQERAHAVDIAAIAEIEIDLGAARGHAGEMKDHGRPRHDRLLRDTGIGDVSGDHVHARGKDAGLGRRDDIGQRHRRDRLPIQHPLTRKPFGELAPDHARGTGDEDVHGHVLSRFPAPRQRIGAMGRHSRYSAAAGAWSPTMFSATIGAQRYTFGDLKTLLAKATPLRSGDQLAGLAAESDEARVAAQYALADLPLTTFLNAATVPYEADEVTRLIMDTHDRDAFAPVAHLTVGGFRDWLLSDAATTDVLSALAPGVTPEMAAAVSKISRLQDLMVAAAKCSVVTRYRNTVGLPGHLSVRLQPNHPTDDPRGIAASILDGLLLGAGDAVIGINPATDSPERAPALLSMLDDIRTKLDIPTQCCVLAHVTTTLQLMQSGSP